MLAASLTRPVVALRVPRPPRWWLPVALLAGLRCCGCESPDDNIIDADLDGYQHPDSRGACVFFDTAPDCNDDDPAIHPGADDPLGDGIDQNCDGVDGVAAPADAAPD